MTYILVVSNFKKKLYKTFTTSYSTSMRKFVLLNIDMMFSFLSNMNTSASMIYSIYCIGILLCTN